MHFINRMCKVVHKKGSNTLRIEFKVRVGAASIQRVAEKAHSRKPTVASPAFNIAFIAVRAVAHRDPVTFCRDKATPTASICYEELHVVAAELLENSSCVEIQGLCRPTHYTRLSSQEGRGCPFCPFGETRFPA